MSLHRFMSIPGGTRNWGSAVISRIYAINNLETVAAVQIAPQRPLRTSITFINPGTTTAYVYPQGFSTMLGPPGQPPLVPAEPSLTALGGCIPVAPQASITLEGDVNIAWSAFSESGTGNPFTVIDNN